MITFVMQLANKMILSSLAVHFIYIALLYLVIEEKQKFRARYVAGNLKLDLAYSAFIGFMILVLSIVSGILTKSLLNIDADDHILRFVMNKLNLENNLKYVFIFTSIITKI